MNYTKTKSLCSHYVENAEKIKTTGVKVSAPGPVDLGKVRFKAKALVAEDNIINQKLIKRTLEDLGIEVDIANNGLEAFEKRKNGDYDIIFMDIQMPIMDGVEATHEILDYEEDYGVEHVPIVALTAHALKGDRERYLAEGLDEYITKPLVKSEVVGVLKKFLSDKIVVDGRGEAKKEAKPAKSEAKAAPAKAREAGEHRPVLICKKSLLESKLLGKIVESLGVEHKIASSFGECMKLAQSGGYEAIFIDKEIEGFDPDAVARLKESGVKVVLFVESESDEDKRIADVVRPNYFDRNVIEEIFERIEIKGEVV